MTGIAAPASATDVDTPGRPTPGKPVPSSRVPGSSRLPGSASLRYVAKSLIRLVTVLFGVLTLLFFLLRSAGDPSESIAGPEASGEQIEKIRQALGFNRPLIDQYWSFITGALRFDFGPSYQRKVDAMGLVLDHLPATLFLIVAAVLLALVIGLPLGMIAALTRSQIYARAMDLVVLIGQAVPVYAIAVVLVYFFAAKLKLVPALASNGVSSGLSAVIIPVFVLSLHTIARVLETTRTGLQESMQEDFTRTAESKGVTPWRVVSGHAIRPVLTSLVTVLGVDFAGLLSGSVVIEAIFAWPGLGAILIGAVQGRDFPVVGAATFVFALIVVVMNLLMDMTYRRLDPRLRKGN
jgi:peptide/nickel transport system permease protein